jgi:hypothetical protein
MKKTRAIALGRNRNVEVTTTKERTAALPHGLGFLPLGTSSLPIQIKWAGAPQKHATVRPPVCPDHPRGGRNADVTRQHVVIECFQCGRRLVVVRGPFRTTVSS